MLKLLIDWMKIFLGSYLKVQKVNDLSYEGILTPCPPLRDRNSHLAHTLLIGK
jgi:hypothetical protein